jgi:TonB family protein
MKFESDILFSVAAHVTFIAAVLFIAGRGAVCRVPERYVQVTLLSHEADMKAGPAGAKKAIAVPAPVPGPGASPPKTAPPRIHHETEVKAVPAFHKRTVTKDVPVTVPLSKKQLPGLKVSAPQIQEEMTGRKKELTVPVREDRDLLTGSGGFAADISHYSTAKPPGETGRTDTAISSAATGLSPSGRGSKDGGTGDGGAKTAKEGSYAAISEIRAAIERAKRYPLFARKRGMEGTVAAEFSINARGLPENVTIKRSSGFAILDSAAKETILRAAPFPVFAGKIEIPITFRLRREE